MPYVPYATHAEIAAELKGLTAKGGFTASTNPTAAQVTEWCTRASHYIDSKIGGKWTVPVIEATSPEAFSLLKDVCVWLVRGRVSSSATTQTGDAKTSSGSGKENWEKKANDVLKEIQTGAMMLTDVDPASSADGAESHTNTESATLQPPTFTKENDNW